MNYLKENQFTNINSLTTNLRRSFSLFVCLFV